MRKLLITNIVLCLSVLSLNFLQVAMSDIPGAYISYVKTKQLDADTKSQVDKIIHKVIEIQHTKSWHKIMIPQYVCGLLLGLNLFALFRWSNQPL